MLGSRLHSHLGRIEKRGACRIPHRVGYMAATAFASRHIGFDGGESDITCGGATEAGRRQHEVTRSQVPDLEYLKIISP